MNPTQTTVARPLDAFSRDVLLRLDARTAAVPADALTLQRRRALMREANDIFVPPQGPVPARRDAVSVDLPGRTLPARLYRPMSGSAPTGAQDVLLVFFHGGGWVLGDLETHDNVCAFLVQHLGCTLLSVEYRKAPEHRFPAPCDDAAQAYAWAASRRADWGCRRVAVAGDSAGGHLAAHALFANPGADSAAALLFYPVADMDFSNTSYTERGAGPGLTSAAMRWFWDELLGSTRAADDARAVLMRQQWGRVPPPVVVSLAWHDPLHDEGVAYAELLGRAGAQVRLLDAGDMSHGFLRQCSINSSARRHIEDAADALQDSLRLAQGVPGSPPSRG